MLLSSRVLTQCVSRWWPAFSSPSRLASSAGPPSGCPSFGLLVDIDGVVVRGSSVIPAAVEAFRLLTDSTSGAFRVPTAFLTNSSSCVPAQRAEQLSRHLQVPVPAQQVVMAQSPLALFSSRYRDQHVLLCGQGPVRDIAARLGFNNTCTVDDLRRAFPALDIMDRERRQSATLPSSTLPAIDAVVLLNEPVRWETTLQLLVDVLLSDGRLLSRRRHEKNDLQRHHLPVLACNIDLQFMAEAQSPRFGHGAFLVCLESLYAKLTGRRLHYTALVGKPCLITYHYAMNLLQGLAAEIAPYQPPLRTVYCIGDNLNADVLGANLYNQHLQLPQDQQGDHQVAGIDDVLTSKVQRCVSVHVSTGVDCVDADVNVQHAPRDLLPVQQDMVKPDMACENMLSAVREIFEREQYS